VNIDDFAEGRSGCTTFFSSLLAIPHLFGVNEIPCFVLLILDHFKFLLAEEAEVVVCVETLVAVVGHHFVGVATQTSSCSVLTYRNTSRIDKAQTLYAAMYLPSYCFLWDKGATNSEKDM